MNLTVVFDFDGVIHSYSSGWKGVDVIPDPPVPGIKEAMKDIHEAGYKIVIVSSRCVCNKGIMAIKEWLFDHGLLKFVDDIQRIKPPAIVYIDDRAICFDGNPSTLLDKINKFTPWYTNKEVIQ